jgi:hypothetical protein
VHLLVAADDEDLRAPLAQALGAEGAEPIDRASPGDPIVPRRERATNLETRGSVAGVAGSCGDRRRWRGRRAR